MERLQLPHIKHIYKEGEELIKKEKRPQYKFPEIDEMEDKKAKIETAKEVFEEYGILSHENFMLMYEQSVTDINLIVANKKLQQYMHEAESERKRIAKENRKLRKELKELKEQAK